jgi:hypothetical protein
LRYCDALCTKYSARDIDKNKTHDIWKKLLWLGFPIDGHIFDVKFSFLGLTTSAKSAKVNIQKKIPGS